MSDAGQDERGARADPPGRLYVYNGGFFAARVRRILTLAGLRPALGWPRPDDSVGVWGKSPTSHRGEAVAARRGAALVRVEDAFLRSVRTGRDGDAPLGLLIDRSGVHFDPSVPSDLERILTEHPLDDTALLDRARAAVQRLRDADLSKYNTHDPNLVGPKPGYVLVVDQTEADASVVASGAGRAQFREMLAFAQIEHPGARILIKTHPETVAGHRAGHFGPEDADGRTALFAEPVSPWTVLEGAAAVYTLSSQMGFEAILAGHKPRVFGQPFYAGWGLTEDERPVARRERRLTRAQLAAAALIEAPTWYDPCRDRLCEVEDAIDHLEARTRAWREDRFGYVATGMRLWKRRPLQGFFGTERSLVFEADGQRAVSKAARAHAPVLVWAGQADAALDAATARAGITLRRVEDGFLRSRGLGAELVPPASLVADDLGIYYDPSNESRLERLIAEAAEFPPGRLRRAERLAARLRASGVSKYNTGAQRVSDLPDGTCVLVPGQVEDDASIRTGCTGAVRTNLGLLEAARAAHPNAVILYKPHPDVEAGLRAGAVPEAALAGLADVVLSGVDAATALSVADEVWTMSSAIGFEALVRGVPVTCLGAPFYAGWGLTDDRAPVPARRSVARPTLAALVHAVLIAYPRYRDPLSGLPCPPEVVVDRLEAGVPPRRGAGNRALAKAQGWLAGYAHLWRRG